MSNEWLENPNPLQARAANMIWSRPNAQMVEVARPKNMTPKNECWELRCK
jgi:hypothetical protein